MWPLLKTYIGQGERYIIFVALSLLNFSIGQFAVRQYSTDNVIITLGIVLQDFPKIKDRLHDSHINNYKLYIHKLTQDIRHKALF